MSGAVGSLHGRFGAAARVALSANGGVASAVIVNSGNANAGTGLPGYKNAQLMAAATGEAGFPGGVVRPGDVDLVAVTARPGVSSAVLAGRIRAALHGGQGYTVATGSARGEVADLNAAVERSTGFAAPEAVIPGPVH